MSKLVDKLERLSEGRGQPLGFGAAASRVRILPMLLIAALPRGNAKAVAAASGAQVDAILVSSADEPRAAPVADAPWGTCVDSVARDEMEQLAADGCDFVVFSAAGSQAAALNVETIGKVLRVDPSLDDSLARAIGRLPIDAVLLQQIGGDGKALTVEQLMVCERLAAWSGKHIIADVPPGLPPGDIESLWGLGAQGLIVDLAVSDPEARLTEIREALEKLPTKRRRQGERLAASLPVSGSPSTAAPPEEDDDDF
jgi:hypothetical protein